MNKPFLLLAGDCHYPLQGTGNWRGRFATMEELRSHITEEIVSGPQAGIQFAVNGEFVDWIEVIDLREGG